MKPDKTNIAVYENKHSSPLFRDYNISTGCYGDQELALVHSKIFFNKHFHRHLVIHITLPAECKNTPRVNCKRTNAICQAFLCQLFFKMFAFIDEWRIFQNWKFPSLCLLLTANCPFLQTEHRAQACLVEVSIVLVWQCFFAGSAIFLSSYYVYEHYSHL